MARCNCKVNKLMIATTVAVFIGITLGLSLRPANLSDDVIAWIRIWGELFIRMFSAVALPIILSCIIVGITGMEGRASGTLGLLTVLYMLTTTFFCLLIAVTFHFIIRPGRKSQLVDMDQNGYSRNEDISYTDLCFDVLRNLIPDNLVSAAMETVYTSVTKEKVATNSSNATDASYTEKKVLNRRYGMNSLGMVFVSIILAYAIRSKKEKAKPIKDFFHALLEVVLSVVNLMMWYSPLGVCCMIAGALLAEPDLLSAFKALLLFVVTVVTALATHAFVFLPITYVIIVRENPLWLYARIFDALLAGFAPATTMITMTVLMDRSKERFETPSSVPNFVLPIAVVFIKNGSTMFICNSILFIAEVQGASINFIDIVIIGCLLVILTFSITLLNRCLVAILTSAVPNIPSGSIFIMILVSSVMQLSVQDILGHIFTVEWLLDRFRTTNNGIGISFSVPIIYTLAQKFTKAATTDLEATEEAEKESLVANHANSDSTVVDETDL